MFWFIAVFIVSFVVAYATAPKPQSVKPSGINDLQVPTAEEGREVPVLFGTKDLKSPNVVWYGDLRTVAIKKKGGKK